MFARPHGEASLHEFERARGPRAFANRPQSVCRITAASGARPSGWRHDDWFGHAKQSHAPVRAGRKGRVAKANPAHGVRRRQAAHSFASAYRPAVTWSPGSPRPPLYRTAEPDNSWSDQSTPQVSVTTPKIPLTSQFPDHRIARGLVNSRATKCLGTVLDNKLGRFEGLNRHPIVSGNSSPTELTVMRDMRSFANIESWNRGLRCLSLIHI